MFVCLCKAVSDHAIEDVIREGGAQSVRGVSATTGAGTVCGTCLPLVEQILEDVLATLGGRPGAGGPVRSTGSGKH